MSRSKEKALSSLDEARRRTASRQGAFDWSEEANESRERCPPRPETPRGFRRALPDGLRDSPSELARSLAETLARLLDEQVHLTVTNNTSTMVSFRRRSDFLRLRVHRMFLGAEDSVVRSLADYVKGSVQAGKRIDAFIRANDVVVREVRRRKQVLALRAQGAIYDLQEIFTELNREFFGSRIEATIGWGREAPSRRRRSIRMGVYLPDAKVIRIHPALDSVQVPRFFVRFVVFHEMLHQVFPPRLVGERKVSHPPEFREAERAYPDYEVATAWERENLGLLLRGRRRRITFDPDDPLA